MVYIARISLGALLLFASTPQATKKQPDTIDTSCTATNHIYTYVHKMDDGTAKLEDRDDWWVTCRVSQRGKKIFDGPLELAHPTEFHEAMVAIDEFRKVRAQQLVKEAQHGTKPSKDNVPQPQGEPPKP